MQDKEIETETKSDVTMQPELAEQVVIEDYNRDIDEAMAEVAQESSYSHEEVVKISENW